MQKRILPILTVMVMLLTVAGAVVAQLPEHKVARGILLSITDDEAVVRTADGNEQLRVRITAGTTLPPQDLEQGDLVIVDYNIGPDPEGTAEARVIRVDERNSGLGSETEPATTSGDTTEATETSESETFESESSTTDSRSARTQTSDQDRSESASTDNTLPETAGSLPMVALLGLISLSLGTLIRFMR